MAVGKASFIGFIHYLFCYILKAGKAGRGWAETGFGRPRQRPGQEPLPPEEP